MERGSVNVDFVISIFVFLITIAFILINIAGNLIPLHRDAETDDIRSKTYQISQLVVFDEGDPKNWDENNFNRIGISNGTKYFVSMAKITSLNSICAGRYDAILVSLFGEDRLLTRINATDSSGRTILDCGSENTRQFSLKRFAVLDTTKEIIQIEFSVKK